MTETVAIHPRVAQLRTVAAQHRAQGHWAAVVGEQDPATAIVRVFLRDPAATTVGLFISAAQALRKAGIV